MNRHRLRARRGFTLVEVCLALLVLSVGVLGAFALFPHGLVESQAASFETQASLFAEMVLRSYRALAVTQSWADLNTARVPVPGVEPGVWSGPDQTAEIIPGRIETYVNTATIPAASGGSGQAIETALRYELVIEDRPPQLKRLTLFVWPGRYGPTDYYRARVYATLLFDGRI